MLQNKTASTFLRALSLIAVLLPLAAGAAAADPVCKRVHSHLFIEAEEVPTCGSPILLCATTTLHGSLQATTEFVGTSSLETDDTPTTGVAILTGDNTFHTAKGDFFTKDAIVLPASGEFAEVDVVVDGTGAYTGATGVLTATGTFVEGVGVGVIEGEICTP